MNHSVSRFGKFELDHTAHELRRDGSTIDLPASAFDCLAYLISHRDRPVGRDELILAVWGRPDVSETLLGQTIVRLRKVLGDSGTDQRSIRTISRKGYRWVAPINSEGEDVGHLAPSGVVRSDLPPVRERHAEPSPLSFAPNWSWKHLSIVVLIAVTSSVLTAIGVFGLFRSSRDEVHRANAINPVLVLPSVVDAPDSWAWLRLGVMDLVANRLRQAGQSTITSESVVGLLQLSTPIENRPTPPI